MKPEDAAARIGSALFEESRPRAWKNQSVENRLGSEHQEN
jgi:hypothetical protein